jgi:hypothetical protein
MQSLTENPLIVWILKFQQMSIADVPEALTKNFTGVAKLRNDKSSNYRVEEITIAETGPKVLPGCYAQMTDGSFVQIEQ